MGIYDSGVYSDNYDFGNSDYSEDQLNNPGLNIDNISDGMDYTQGQFQAPWDVGATQPETPMYQSDMFQGQNNFGQGIQPMQGLNSVGDFGNAGNLTGPMEQPSGSVMNSLAQLFNSKQGQGLVSGLGALMSGYTNKQKGQQFNQLASQLRQSSDPFGSQRAQYQAELSRAVQDPYSSPIVRNQVDAIQHAQSIKDAAAGRRSNSATSSPAMLAAQAQIAQDYIKSLYTPAGANINPNTSNYMSAMQNAINANSNGYLSPLASAIGYNQQGGINSDQLAAALQKLQSGGQ